jgi:mono/diheme cytochrome c family protein
MRSPPPGTVARGRDHVGDRVIATGQDENEDAKRVPLPLTRALLENGRARFDEICATCHGVLGDGVSVVAEKMRLRKPPSLFEARISQQAPGRVFRTISQGFGLMPSYAAALSIDERWAVVAYIEALRLSQAAPVAELSPALRAELARRAP